MSAWKRSQGVTLIELLMVIIGILAAIAVPTCLDQREKAKDLAVKGGTHTIELGVASTAVDQGDTYRAAVADKTGLVDAGGTGFTLAGHMSDGDFVVS